MSTDDKQLQQWVPVGKLSGLYGVKGWVKIFSNTQPKENILTYSPWFLKRDGQWQEFELLAGKIHGKGVIAQLSGCTDRDIAAELIGSEIAIKSEQLAKPASGEYYWNDLIGLSVVTRDGKELGQVSGLMQTGANDVLVVSGERERLIPFIREQVVLAVDADARRIEVDWDPEF